MIKIKQTTPRKKETGYTNTVVLPEDCICWLQLSQKYRQDYKIILPISLTTGEAYRKRNTSITLWETIMRIQQEIAMGHNIKTSGISVS